MTNLKQFLMMTLVAVAVLLTVAAPAAKASNMSCYDISPVGSTGPCIDGYFSISTGDCVCTCAWYDAYCWLSCVDHDIWNPYCTPIYQCCTQCVTDSDCDDHQWDNPPIPGYCSGHVCYYDSPSSEEASCPPPAA